jgi:hypothetical protein
MHFPIYDLQNPTSLSQYWPEFWWTGQPARCGGDHCAQITGQDSFITQVEVKVYGRHDMKHTEIYIENEARVKWNKALIYI